MHTPDPPGGEILKRSPRTYRPDCVFDLNFRFLRAYKQKDLQDTAAFDIRMVRIFRERGKERD
eukprot:833679-Amorphochlora_amoeboformis.AAC.1